MKNILILDDHKVILNLVGKYIESNIDVEIETALSIDEFVSKTENNDIYIIDLSLEEGTGFDVLDILSKKKNHNVIIYTSNINPGIIRHLFKHKLVKGIVNKASDESQLLEAIQAIQKGEKHLCNKSIRLLNMTRKNCYDLTENMGELSPREREVLNHIWNNLSSEEIADKLSISSYTVENHRKNIKRKLGADSLISVIKIAMEKGYINTLQDQTIRPL